MTGNPNIIVNADDFGRDECATRAIAECFRRGWIHRTTLMVNMPFAEEAVAIARQEGFMDKVGLHLNLTEGRPLSDEMIRSRFCDRTGCFNLMRNLRNAIRPFGFRTCDALRAEIIAQIGKFKGFGLPLLHCDSHHHVHSWLPVASVVLPILKHAGVLSVRRPYNVGIGWGGRNLMRRGRNALFMMLIRKTGLSTTDWFTGLAEYLEAPADCPGTVELMAHPYLSSSGEVIDMTNFESHSGHPMREIK